MDDPTCNWPGMNCAGDGTLIAPGEQKEISMDFTEAINQAKVKRDLSNFTNFFSFSLKIKTSPLLVVVVLIANAMTLLLLINQVA